MNGFIHWFRQRRERFVSALIGATLCAGLFLVGGRAFQLSYTLYRLKSVGQMGAAIVTDRHPHSAHTIAYSLDYRCNGVSGECQVPVDIYQASRMGRPLSICYDPDNPGRSWVWPAMPRLFWTAVFFDGTFCLLLGCAVSLWIASRGKLTTRD